MEHLNRSHDKVYDYTVDFIIQRNTGRYLCKKAITKEYQYNHLHATSFNTRADAERTLAVLRYKDAIIVKRECRLESSNS